VSRHSFPNGGAPLLYKRQVVPAVASDRAR